MSKSTKPDSPKPEQAEGLALILERNHFYRDRYRVQLRVSAGILILALLLAAILGWLITHPEEPRYFRHHAHRGIDRAGAVEPPEQDR